MKIGTAQVICHPKFKLRTGCLNGQECNKGSCVSKALKGKLPASKYPFSKGSADCPSWQTSIQGRCYSTCENDTGCDSGRRCYQYVCRKACGKSGKCSKGEKCELQSETAGFCMPISTLKLSSKSSTKTNGNFDLPFRNLALSNFKTTGQLIIENNATQPTTFTIKPLSDSLGVKGQPLSWLQFAICKTYTNKDRVDCKSYGSPQKLTSGLFTLQSVPAKTRMIVRVSNAAARPKGVDTYTGQLQVEGTQLGTQRFSVDYNETVAGQWQGKMVFFGSFERYEYR